MTTPSMSKEDCGHVEDVIGVYMNMILTHRLVCSTDAEDIHVIFANRMSRRWWVCLTTRVAKRLFSRARSSMLVLCVSISHLALRYYICSYMYIYMTSDSEVP